MKLEEKNNFYYCLRVSVRSETGSNYLVARVAVGTLRFAHPTKHKKCRVGKAQRAHQTLISQ